MELGDLIDLCLVFFELYSNNALDAGQAASWKPVPYAGSGVLRTLGHSGDGACVNPSREGKFSGLACLALLGLRASWAVATADCLHSFPAHSVVTLAYVYLNLNALLGPCKVTLEGTC